MADEREPPLLFISDPSWTQKDKHLIYSIKENRSQSLNVNVLVGKEIKGSSYGWLVIVGDNEVTRNHECCLFHPVSGDIIALPNLIPEHFSSTRCVLSKPPTEPDCHILFNSTHDQDQWFCRVGDHNFVKVPYTTGQILKAMVSFEGQIYGLVKNCVNHELVTIHFVDKTLELRPVVGTRPWIIPQLSPPWSPGPNCNLMWLVESAHGGRCGGAELLLVQKSYSCRYLEHPVEFRVFRINMEKMEFVELQRIGDRTIFISHYGSVFCRSSSVGGLKANSIYYTEERGRNLYVFDLEDKSTTSIMPSSTASRKSFSSWVQHSSCHTFFTN